MLPYLLVPEVPVEYLTFSLAICNSEHYQWPMTGAHKVGYSVKVTEGKSEFPSLVASSDSKVHC